MKKAIPIALVVVIIVAVVVGVCLRKEPFPSDEEIMEHMTAYLENTVFQDPASYPSLNDFISANFGMSDKEFSQLTLYMGAPNQNTTFFLMATKADGADTALIKEKLENRMQSAVKTAEMGYMSGYTGYSIQEKGDKIFAVMHEDAGKYNEIQAYLNSF